MNYNWGFVIGVFLMLAIIVVGAINESRKRK